MMCRNHYENLKLILAFEILLIHTVVGNDIFHIEPSPDSECLGGEPCLTLSTMDSSINLSNTTLIFQEGNHVVDTDLTVSNIEFLTLLTNDSATASITCSPRANLKFFNITKLQISGLEFDRCGCSVELVDHFTLELSSFRGSNHGSALQLTQTNATIIRSTFTSNAVGTYLSRVGFLSGVSVHSIDVGASVGGALILTSTNLYITSSEFTRNVASLGGAIFAQMGSDVTIKNSTFDDNKAVAGCFLIFHDHCHGGALLFDSGCTLKTENNTFLNNRAGYTGGVISLLQGIFFDKLNTYIDNSAAIYGGAIFATTSSTVVIDSSHYSKNTVTFIHSHGGAIHVGHDSSTTVYNSSFDNCESGLYGGVMSVQDSSSITVYNSTFDKNVADKYGGVIYIDSGGSITVHNSSFNNSKVDRDGGVIYAETQDSSITVYNSSFGNSEAAGSGGVIYASRTRSINVYNSFFYNNEAGIENGVMHVESRGSITVYDSSFKNNLAGKSAGVMGAKLSSSITIYNSLFEDNAARDQGGVMYAQSSSKITVYNSSFVNNEASNDGGVIFAHSGCSVIVYNSSFDNNKAFGNGGVMYEHFNNSITVYSSSFSNNTAGIDAGVLYAFDFCNISVYQSSFDDNEAGRDAGVMYVSCSSIITVYNTTIDNNRANNSGGVIYETRGYIQAFSCRLDTHVMFRNNEFGNNSAFVGGVVYVRNALLSDFGSVYHLNSARFSGGVIALDEGVVRVAASTFTSNTAENAGGTLFTPYNNYQSHITFEESNFHSNTASSGGVIAMLANDLLTVEQSRFTHNRASRGGVIYLLTRNVATLDHSNFSYNTANNDGGVIYLDGQNRLTINNSRLNYNIADINGGVVCSIVQTELIIAGEECIFIGNTARRGGVIYASESKVDIYSQNLLMENNTVRETGGAIHLSRSDATFVSGHNVLLGNAAHSGGALYASENKVNFNSQSLLLAKNTAIETGGAVHLSKASATFVNVNSTLVGNSALRGGAMYASESKVDVHSHSLLMSNNRATETGGAVHLYQASLTFTHDSKRTTKFNDSDGENATKTQDIIFPLFSFCTLVGNQADHGGAMYASKSKVIIKINSQTKIRANSAITNGGGMYLTTSELKFGGYISYITGNTAGRRGGGLHTDNSSIIIEREVYFTKNEAEDGGGTSLESYSKFYGISTRNYSNSMVFASNIARRYGGAIYVGDETNPELCAAGNAQNATSNTQCFSTSVFMSWSNNSAGVAGSNLFGGLLNWCTVYNETFMHESKTGTPFGVLRFLSSSNIDESQLDTISSHPVRLCFCRNSLPDCDYHPDVFQVNRGNQFSIDLIAFDQSHRAVNASIHSSLNSSAGGLGEDEDIQQINNLKVCTEVHFNIFSPRNLEQLTMSILGPCNVLGVSQQSITIEITCKCPIGFQISNTTNGTSCDCVCNQVLQPYDRTECDAQSQTITRKDNFWITYKVTDNDSMTGDYVIYQNCPYDYCHPPDEQVRVNLNIPEGSDAQCASNRSGTLCGNCKPGFSVSLGSSSCYHCPAYWPGLLIIVVIVFIFSGIFLVALILVLNLTVAIGTLNAIIFYANIMAANRSALFSTSKVSFASVFISWLNFDLGFDTCFFDGMDTYVKTWLQLAFPAYIIFLVVVIIQLSNRFVVFGRLVGKKDPVATLATLILLSYAKFLQTIITAFSSATLHYPGNTKVYVWLPDASVRSLSAKHALLLFAAILILVVGLIYTFLLFCWQWILRCPRKRLVGIRNQKVRLFLETFHVPYTLKHRYWTGLLLFVRVIVYLVSGFNPSNDPRITLLSTNFIISCLVIYMATFGVRIYKKWLINAMETFTYFNIIAVTLFTWYTLDSNNTNQVAVTNTSIGIMFVMLVLIISYHVFKHTNQKLLSKIKETSTCIKLKEMLGLQKEKRANHRLPPGDGNIHRSHELLDMIDHPVNNNDYNVPQVKPEPAKPTQSVVELSINPDLVPLSQLMRELQEEQELVSEHQSGEEEHMTMPEENQSQMTNKSIVCINDSSRAEISEAEPKTGLECGTTQKENLSVPKHDAEQNDQSETVNGSLYTGDVETIQTDN